MLLVLLEMVLLFVVLKMDYTGGGWSGSVFVEKVSSAIVSFAKWTLIC